MEPWLIFAIISIFTSGFNNFFQKVAAERDYDIWLLNIYTYVLSSIWASVNKEVMLNQYNISVYIFIVFTIQVIISIWKYKLSKIKKIKYNKQWIIQFGILSWIVSILAKIVFIKMLEWNLAVAFTINSFSILIPIILSIIFYKDHFDFKKWLVIALSIISIILFI